ncbi:MAG: methyl-accepting chemotaxis protein [Syntrophomonadaceae bacterium]|nr:methyl-accepting chemotaxis protein [Syntrophomonadaceae bacterium]
MNKIKGIQLRSIRTRLLVIITGISILTLAILCSVLYNQSQVLLTKQIETAALKVAENGAEQVESWLEARAGELEVMARFDAVQTMDWNAAGPVLREQWESMSENYEMFILAEPDGTAHLTTTEELYDISSRDYFQGAMRGQVTYGEAIISQATGNIVLTIGVPVKDSNGNIIGILAGIVQAETLTEIAASMKAGETGYGYIIQKDGLAIAHPNKENILTLNLLENENQELQAAAREMVAGKTGIGRYTYEGVEKLNAYAPVELTGWSVAVTVPMEELEAPLADLLSKSVASSAVAIIALVLIMVFVSGSIAKPIQKLNQLTAEIAQGNLNKEADIKTNDEIGELAGSFNAMVSNLRNLVQQINQNSEEVIDSSTQLAASAQQTGKAAEEVSRSVEEMSRAATAEAEDAQKTAEIIREMASALQQVGNNTEKVSNLSASFQDIVKQGLEAVEEQTKSMGVTISSAESVSGSIADLEAKSKQIGEIVGTITNIAEQTNLLALNAAIEAARAGEHGRGFAVVAEEVRKLAEESGEAADNIAQIITEIQKSTEQVVNDTNEAQNNVKKQEEAVLTVQNLFGKIEAASRDIDSAVQEVSAAVEEMLASSDEAVGAMENISSSTQEAAASAEEISAVVEEQTASVQTIADLAEKLSKGAEELKQAIRQFNV